MRNRHVAQRFRSEPDEENEAPVYKLNGIAGYQRKTESIQRTLECFEGKRALLAEWGKDHPDADRHYVSELRKKVDMYRTQLKYKGYIS